MSLDGRWVVTVCPTELGKAIVQVWDVQTELSLFEPISFDISVQSKGFGPDGTTVRLLSRTGIHLWHCKTGRIFKPQLGEKKTSPSETISLSPDGNKLLTDSATSSTSIQIWEIPTGRLLATLAVPWVDGYTGQFIPDSLRVLIRTTTGHLQIWDIAGRLLSDISNPPAVVGSAKFSQIGDWVVASYQNKTMRIWDGHTGLPVTEPIRYGGAPWLSGEFSSESRSILVKSPENLVDNPSASSGHTLVLWEIRWGSPISEMAFPDGSLRDQPVLPEWVSASTIPAITNSLIPNWLPDMAEGVAGLRFTQQRDPEAIPWKTRLTLKERVLGSADDTLYKRWAE
ncbi:MAG: WD40 repeat domain-containing protein [Pedosphaera sp.]|nr:WD40 repeat domain-containing protein [Pedosphaera sp.]